MTLVTQVLNTHGSLRSCRFTCTLHHESHKEMKTLYNMLISKLKISSGLKARLDGDNVVASSLFKL